MDFHSAMETFAEAWVAANTQTALTTESQPQQQIFAPPYPRLTDLSMNRLPLPPSSQETVMQHPQMGEVLRCPIPDAHKQLVVAGSAPGKEAVKSIPVHCVVEQQHGTQTFDTPSSGVASGQPSRVELDSYAIIPNNTPFCDIVQVALGKLGYSASEAIGAKGAIQIKNWKPLAFTAITDDDSERTVGDILGDLTTMAYLRIRLNSHCTDEDDWSETTVKRTVKDLLKEYNQPVLAKISPLAQSAISKIANNKYDARISREKCRSFARWYKQFITKEKYERVPPTTRLAADSRLTFHPEYELPLMRSWYHRWRNPTLVQLQENLNELNSGPFRQDRPKVTLLKLKNWWKNERQRERNKSGKKTDGKGSSSEENNSMDVEVEKLESPHLAAQEQRQDPNVSIEGRSGGGPGRGGGRGGGGGGGGGGMAADNDHTTLTPLMPVMQWQDC